MQKGMFKGFSSAPLPPGVRTVFFDAGNTLLYLDLAWIAHRLSRDGWEIKEEGLFYGQSVAAYEASRLALLKRYPTDADRHTPYFSRVLELAGIPRYCISDCVNVLLDEHKDGNLWRVVPDFVRETLASLKGRGYILGVVSNTDGRLQSLLNDSGLTSFFTCIVDSAVVGCEKPDPGIFQHAIVAAETDPRHCVFIGDIYAVDVAGANRSGITGILIDPMALHGEFDCIRIAKLSDVLELLPSPEGTGDPRGH